jgi:hypothetical protein
LSDAFEAQIGYVSRPGQVLDIWRSFTASVPISGVSKSARSALDGIGTELEERLRAGLDPLSYLVEANGLAHHRIRLLLRRLGAEELLAAEPAPITVSLDRYGTRASASSSRTGNQISWAFQRSARAFWAALAVEPVLQHEYLSHLAPRNPWLSFQVREGWLMELLVTEVRNSGLPESEIDLRLLKYLRERLGADPELGDLAAYGSLGLRDTALLMLSRNSALFWRLTKEMLVMEPSEEGARRADDLLQKLEPKGYTELCEIFASAGPVGLEGLLDVLRGR